VNDLILNEKLDSANLLNDLINVNSDIDANRKTVYEIYIRLLQENLLSATDSSTLLAIAKQDPLVAGDAVYGARVILNYDPNESTVRNANALHSEFSSPIFIYPNPANEEIFIKNVLSADLIYSVISIEGNLLSEGEIKETQSGKTIPIKLLNPGIYILKITIANQPHFRTKFVIAR
ncbi:MAG: T9SS type A sorting domain-containing protein, partial [Ignavibacteria bacterium]|nr:T9SS type A sorting domain-containing protein [Ignavibacteria bacterium]